MQILFIIFFPAGISKSTKVCDYVIVVKITETL